MRLNNAYTLEELKQSFSKPHRISLHFSGAKHPQEPRRLLYHTQCLPVAREKKTLEAVVSSCFHPRRFNFSQKLVRFKHQGKVFKFLQMFFQLIYLNEAAEKSQTEHSSSNHAVLIYGSAGEHISRSYCMTLSKTIFL